MVTMMVSVGSSTIFRLTTASLTMMHVAVPFFSFAERVPQGG